MLFSSVEANVGGTGFDASVTGRMRFWESDPVKTADGMISPKKSTTVT